MAKIKTKQGLIYFKPQRVYLGIKQIDKAIAFENLKLVADIMNATDINWGPALGSLLGIIRDNDFITWDEDIDLYILEEEKEKFYEVLPKFIDAGFDIIREWRSGVISIKKDGEYIDFYYLKTVGDNIRCAVGEVFFFEKYLTDTIKWDFKGITLNVPREYEEFLEFRYGNWRTPVQYADFDMGFYRKYKMIFLLWVKNYVLPDCIYYPMFRRHHQPALDKFVNKCKAKGIILPSNLSLENYKV